MCLYRKKECVAMLLAGGQGSRLYSLTEATAKPAIPYGGKYRLIDFALSNCANSGLDTVGVLTQYRPQELNAYIGNGQPWDLDSNDGGVFILPPYMTSRAGEWYKGSANSVYQNIDFVERFSPDYVIVLGCDNIYKMDYSLMLDQHKKKGSTVTIAVTDVTYEEAKGFGVIGTGEDDRIAFFEEKPEQPRSTLASMGLYVFTWPALREYLIRDENNPASANDFGKSIIPAMMADGVPMHVHRFPGYWRDVGTVESLWEANMDLLGEDGLSFGEESDSLRIYTRNLLDAPHYLAPTAEVSNCILGGECEIYGAVEDSVVFNGAMVEEGAVVRHSVLFPNTRVKRGATVEYALVGDSAVVAPGARVGAPPDESAAAQPPKITLIAPGATVAVTP